MVMVAWCWRGGKRCGKSGVGGFALCEVPGRLSVWWLWCVGAGWVWL